MKIHLKNAKPIFIPARAIKDVQIIQPPVFIGSDIIVIEATEARFDESYGSATAIYQKRGCIPQYPISLRFNQNGTLLDVFQVCDIEHQLYLKAIGGNVLIEYDEVNSRALSTHLWR